MNHAHDYPSSVFCQDLQRQWWGPPDSYYEPPCSHRRASACPWCGSELEDDSGLCPSCDDPKDDHGV